MLSYETFVGKGYDHGGLFRLSLFNVCNNVLNDIVNLNESNI
jgi:hypothetical protein